MRPQPHVPTELRILLAVHLDVQCLANLSEKAITCPPVVLPMKPLDTSGRDTVVQIEGKKLGLCGASHWFSTQRASTDEAG